MSNLDTILAYLKGPLGLSSAQAAGVAGNLQVESGFNPSAYNAAEGAIGIAQWEGGRRTNLERYAASTGGSVTDLGTQLSFLGSELNGPESGALQRLRATSDPATAAAVFDQYYERSAGTSRSKRVANAQAIAGQAEATDGGSGNWFTSLLFPQYAPALAIGEHMPDWGAAVMKIALYTLGVATAAGLFIVGAVHTVSEKG